MLSSLVFNIFLIFLQALKEGCWVLLDELNLAPQSVLEAGFEDPIISYIFFY